MWLGRGDAEIDNWRELRAEASRAHNERTAAYLVGTPISRIISKRRCRISACRLRISRSRFETGKTEIQSRRPLALRSHEALGKLRAQNVIVQIRNPLAAGTGHIQIFDSILDMGRDAVPVKSGIFVDDVGRR